MLATAKTLAEMTRMTMALAGDLCGGKVLEVEDADTLSFKHYQDQVSSARADCGLTEFSRNPPSAFCEFQRTIIDEMVYFPLPHQRSGGLGAHVRRSALIGLSSRSL